jgi:hypothetical protein
MRALALVFAILLVPTLASADPDADKPVRYGLFGGLAAHGGNISCDGGGCGDDFRKAVGGDGHIGWMFNAKLGVMLDLWGMTSEENDLTISYFAGTVNLRYYPVPIFWIQGGLGNGHANVKYRTLIGTFEGQSDDVPVGQLAVGLEVVRAPRWALDVELKLAQSTSTDDTESDASTGRMVGFGVGFTWFGSR